MTSSNLIAAQALLFTQGFGTRHECIGTIVGGHFQFEGVVITDPFAELEATDGAHYCVKGKPWQFHRKAYLVLHKPAGYECSTKPRHHPSAYSLLPGELRVRDVQAVGRLDEDTTGLLIFSDDGQFIHKVTSPKHKAHKVYLATLKHAGDDALCERLRKGVMLNDSSDRVVPVSASLIDEMTLELVLTEGKYHQVKRMVAAVGNRVEALHRSRVGSHSLRSDCIEGQWYWLSKEELAEIGY
jgi:16S rRNA pseudouridine516 synthase